jgi:hypothetical protein
MPLIAANIRTRGQGKTMKIIALFAQLFFQANVSNFLLLGTVN